MTAIYYIALAAIVAIAVLAMFFIERGNKRERDSYQLLIRTQAGQIEDLLNRWYMSKYLPRADVPPAETPAQQEPATKTTEIRPRDPVREMWAKLDKPADMIPAPRKVG